MILVFAVFIGLAAGLIRAWVNKTKFQITELRYPGIVILAFIPQFIAFALPATRSRLPDAVIPILLIVSLLFLLAFSILNIHNTGFWPMIFGLLLNFLVISLNGGWMPISPETVQKLIPDAPQRLVSWQPARIRQRHGACSGRYEALGFVRSFDSSRMGALRGGLQLG